MSTSNAKSIVTAKNLSFVLPTGEFLFEGLDLSINQGDKIALIGTNGVGKSTLMKILAGIVISPTGSVESATVSYLDQLDEGVDERGDSSIQELLNSSNEDWWQLQLHFEKLFKKSLPDLSRHLNQLSGGEYMRLKLAVATYDNPEILLLDEPTNHLDISSKEILRKFIEDFPGGLMIISHDISFIDQIADEVWELEDKKLVRYGGNYQDYLRQKAQKEQSKNKRLVEAQKEVDKKEWAMVREIKRAAKSKRQNNKPNDRSMSRSEKGYFKEKAEVAATKNKETINIGIDKAREIVQINTTANRKLAKLDLYEGANERGRTLLDIQDGTLSVGSKKLIENINFEIKFGEKIYLAGENGSGKTSLIKALLDQPSPGVELTGRHIFRIPNLLGMYISQRYDQIDRKKTLLENIYLARPSLNPQIARRALGNLLFKENHEISKLAGGLSGGETARLAFAMASISPSDLLVLDEPTNNLDIDTVNVIIQALAQFSGAVLVVSHDINFLKQIGIEKAFKIENQSLVQIKNLPTDVDFYNEITKV